MATIYLGMVTLGMNGRYADNVSCAGFKKENVKSELTKIACEVLHDIPDAYSVTEDWLDPDDAFELRCNSYPREIRYWIKDVTLIDEP